MNSVSNFLIDQASSLRCVVLRWTKIGTDQDYSKTGITNVMTAFGYESEELVSVYFFMKKSGFSDNFRLSRLLNKKELFS